MNLFARMGCRIYQGAFRLVTPLLPWREPELLQGEGSVDRLPQLIKSKGVTKVLIVTDKGLVGTGLVAKLTESFDKGGIKYCLFDETVANPTINNIESALKLYKSESCNGIVAIGGGSPMDCAKGVGARVVKPNKQIPKMKGLLKVGKELPTMFAIPTTSGTGSETTIAAVITNSDTHEKYALNDPHLIPRYAVLDPMLTVGLPKHIT
ncbi:MAG: iron-containing alcohol dehydrogenase, partial [Clostridia bacterium]